MARLGGRERDDEAHVEGWGIAPRLPSGTLRSSQGTAAITDLDHSIEHLLEQSQERYLYTLALSPLIAWTADRNGGIIEIDANGLDMFGLTASSARGLGFFSAVHPEDRPSVAAMWRENASLGHPIDQTIRIRLQGGGYRWFRSRAAPRRDALGSILRWYGTIEDIHDRKLADDKLRWTAEHDGLTGLSNRLAFQKGLKAALEWSDRQGSEVALMLMDVDNFKLVNDQYGHDAGDALLQTVASTLKELATGRMMAGRLGGDEFALFLIAPDRSQLDQAVADAIQLLDGALRDGDGTYGTRLSIGVAVYPTHASDVGTLRKNADLSLYEAKVQGGGICYFTSAMRSRMQNRLSALSVARDAVNAGYIVPYYQPKVDLVSGEIAGFEALLRWQPPGRAVQAPDAIAMAFEDNDLALEIGDRMRDLVAADIRCWLDAGVPFQRIAINVSSVEFRKADFALRLLDGLARRAIPPTCLEVEVTETVFLSRDLAHVSRLIGQLNAAGVTIALDDFGTGYASLAHLNRFPVDVLKIDRSFVGPLAQSRNDAIVRAIIGLGRSLGIMTVAEGVETVQQARRLRSKGCDFAQGFLYSPAVPAAEVPALLKKKWPDPKVNRRRTVAAGQAAE
jgi:diguanylate cyclase (GGDEF)-like protein/PAS domain S-box-containing protein